MEDIGHYDIPIYNFPYDVEEDDEETIQDNAELRVSFLSLDTQPSPASDDPFQAMLPFAVIGSEEEVEIDGVLFRARIYPWGIAEVDNPKHSDFTRLRGAILG